MTARHIVRATIASAAVALVAAAAAGAHVEPSRSTAPANGFTSIGFTIPHGCDGSATRQVSIQIPAGVTTAKPMPKAGWKITIAKGKTNPAGINTVTWTGGPLPDAYFDEFTLLLGMPNTPGKTVYFKTVQRCVKGVNRWVEIPKSGAPEPEFPAPAVKLTRAVKED